MITCHFYVETDCFYFLPNVSLWFDDLDDSISIVFALWFFELDITKV